MICIFCATWPRSYLGCWEIRPSWFNDCQMVLPHPLGPGTWRWPGQVAGGSLGGGVPGFPPPAGSENSSRGWGQVREGLATGRVLAELASGDLGTRGPGGEETPQPGCLGSWLEGCPHSKAHVAWAGWACQLGPGPWGPAPQVPESPALVPAGWHLLGWQGLGILCLWHLTQATGLPEQLRTARAPHGAPARPGAGAVGTHRLCVPLRVVSLVYHPFFAHRCSPVLSSAP